MSLYTPNSIPKPEEYKHIPIKEWEHCLLLLSMFQIDKESAHLLATPGQIEIFWVIVYRKYKRVNILCATQYGKSLFVALACIVVIAIQGRMIAVVAPTNDKAKIIMRYIIEHMGDHILFEAALEKNTKLERLQLEGSKDRIILNTGGGIFVVSAQTNNSQRTVEAAMGLGAENVILDEACLVPDDTEATIYRMIAGKGPDAFYCKIGNPFYRSSPYTHFYQTSKSKRYHQVFIDYKQALAEGRYNPVFIEEAREKPQFDILFECMFPAEDVATEGGWVPLLTTEELRLAQYGAEAIIPFGEKRAALDIAASGSNESVMVVRSANVAYIKFSEATSDLMTLTGRFVRETEEINVKGKARRIDGIGLGIGISSRLYELGEDHISVNVAQPAVDAANFSNLRAESYWRLRQWIKTGGKLFPDKRWYQLTDVKYTTDSSGRVRVMSKEEMAKRGIPSPDVGDAAMLTCTEDDRTFRKQQEPEVAQFDRIMRQKRLKDKGINRHGKKTTVSR